MALRMTQPAAASVAGRPRALLQPGCQVPRLLVAPGPGARAATAPEQQSPASSLVARAAASDERGMQMPELLEASTSGAAAPSELELKAAARKAQRAREQMVYKVSAIAATVGVTSLAIVATWLRFSWHLQTDGEVPWVEMAATLTLVAGGMCGMEMYARYAHKVLWHDFAPGWALHKSHHMPRTGPFEDNDIFAVANGVPAFLLCLYGFMTPGISGGLCFGAGLGITLFGIMYMFVHDGLVHRRFPVGPIADLPYLRRVAVAHQLHHANKYGGAPWGMFLGPQEIESLPGGKEELDRMVAELEFSKVK